MHVLTKLVFGLVVLTLQGCLASDTILRDEYHKGFNECKAQDLEASEYTRGQRDILQNLVNEQVGTIRGLRSQLGKCGR